MLKGLIGFLLCAAAALLVIVGLGEAADLGIQPVWVFLEVILLACLLIGVVKFPAAFAVPILFASRQMVLPIPRQFHELSGLTAIRLGAGLLALAVFFRLLKLSIRGHSPSLGDLLRNQGKRITTFALFAVLVTLSYLHTPSPVYGGRKLLSFLTVGALTFLAPFVLLNGERDFRDFAMAAVGLALLEGTGRIIAGSHGTFGAREEVTHIGVGQLVGMAILLILNYKFVEGRWARYLLILCLPCLAAGLIASEARGPLFSLLLVLGAFAFTRRAKMSLISPRTAVLGVALVVTALVIVPGRWFHGEAADKYRVKSQETVDLLHGSYTDQGSGGRRLVFFDSALAGIAEKPVAGWGLGGWAGYYYHSDRWSYPHNLFLEVWLEEGIFGFAALLAFLTIGFKAAKKAFDEPSGRFAFVLPMLAYCVLLTTSSGDIDDNRFVWFWCGVAFVASRMIASGFSKEQPQQEPAPVNASIRKSPSWLAG